MANLKFYLTSLESGIEQNIYSQSVGGCVSDTLLYPETTLSSNVGLYDSTLQLDPPVKGWTNWEDIKYLNIGNEIVEIEEIGNEVKVVNRAVNSILNMHIASDVVKGIPMSLFNDVFNDNYKQYRCIAVKNLPDENNEYLDDIAQAINVFINPNSSNNNSFFRIAIEVPKNQFFSSDSSDWTSSTIIDNSIIGVYDDNYFTKSNLKINEGPNKNQERIIESYDSQTGTFVLNNSLPYDNTSEYNNVISYEVEPSPAQRVNMGTQSPITTYDNVTNFREADKESPVYLDFYNQDGALNVNDVFYIWIEREIEKGSKEFINNFCININYNVGV
ncbi:MAG: hypothetical protein ACOCRK_05090 [bacterium]